MRLASSASTLPRIRSSCTGPDSTGPQYSGKPCPELGFSSSCQVSRLALSRWRPVQARTVGGRKSLALGHEVQLIAPRYVKPYVKRQKNDAADAEAIAEAASRPSMRFGAVHTEFRHEVVDFAGSGRTEVLTGGHGKAGQ